MASVGDYIFLFIVLSILAGIVYAVKKDSINQSISGAQEGLKQKGIRLDSSGVSIKTDRRAPTRDEYIDRTRESFARSSEVIAKHKDAFTTTAWQKQKELDEAKQRAKATSGRR
ncbi:hypothetical protein BDZ90DRAFT_259917 [Jaminaea rosea]|uniref:Uncharacterized protein n=1 Tax=Jaminaea rosea TaxID=1569628 RepID=A0A316US28_9BASI|nr:hypothetical protein BDZ90DRAFT_259917 [Jaminaea rosea]PWN28092.1 hypothetical protein BDZ90DRAFT_259917 [Jaminaea rosea]